MEYILSQDRKERKITLHKSGIFHDIDVLSYKLAETAIAEAEARDNVASDSEDGLDGAVLSPLIDNREMELRKRLAFCLKEREVIEIDNTPDLDADYVFELVLPKSFKDAELKTAMKLMHDYIVSGALLDWYTEIGTSYGVGLVEKVAKMESQIVDIFRVPGIVKHPQMIYFSSYRNR